VGAWDDVRSLALSLPETSERISRGNLQWLVRDKLFVWERPLRKSDLAALGDQAPTGPVVAARVEHLLAKDAVIASDPAIFFTTPHFDGYPAVLARLELLAGADLEEFVTEGWLARAPRRLAHAFLSERDARRYRS
jgi:hypothetical protein